MSINSSADAEAMCKFVLIYRFSMIALILHINKQSPVGDSEWLKSRQIPVLTARFPGVKKGPI